ncbi:MAG: GNAT family N-acetyltransferase [Maribacter sp.]|nr:GNAT family N-acetyltransferase [Maribacter sp.]NNK19174.1 GNAT family N-acetyltransferase [Maribacter sp.]
MIKVIQATEKNIDEIVPLFDEYRVFYKQERNLEGARNFIVDRFNNKESIIFLAYFNGQPAGFTQLYPMFSSVSMQRSYVLNDLYVHPTFRNKQIGEALLNSAKEFCNASHAKGLSLETAIDNPAQKLYEKLGWEKDEACFHYFWKAK